ncbi:MAG TPA: GspMb/PilO family protein [Candidatus Saccharimonadales bacterium]|jgi:Tfp pilus assembly protein PilO|nr:GspMb/PilO family protein [Candidatus Saccharimonadales bacterium]
MKSTILHRNNVIRAALAIILIADAALIGIQWKLNNSPHVQTSDLTRLTLLEKQYRADNTRLERFRTELPADEKQWDEFFNTHFHPAGAGYSAISEDLGDLSRTAGLRSDSISFHQHAPDARGLMQVDITTAVEGDYDNLVQFLNKLEHSDNFYVLDSLALAPSTVGKLRLNMQLRTYFRTT